LIIDNCGDSSSYLLRMKKEVFLSFKKGLFKNL